MRSHLLFAKIGQQGLVIAGLVCCVLVPANATAEDAMIMPLAPQSLLLDVGRAGKRLVVVGERGHILLSDDEGGNWVQAQVPTRQMLTAVHFANPERGWAVGHDGLIFATVDGGEHWVLQRDGLRDQVVINALNLKSLQAAKQGLQQALLAANSRTQREALQLDMEDLQLDIEDAHILQEEAVHAPPLLAVFFQDELRGIAVGAFNTLLLTDDGGISWIHAPARLDNPEAYHLNSVTGDGKGSLWIAGEGGVLYRSRDNGLNWVSLASPYQGSWFGISRAPQSGRLLVFGLRGNVFYSRDGGDNWLASTTTTDRSLAGGGYLSERYAMLVGAVGTLLVSENGGATFDERKLNNRVNLSGVALAGDRAVLVGQGGVHIAEGVGGDL